MKILVVEDEREQAAALVEALEAERHAVDQAPDGPAADGLMQLNAYDLVMRKAR